MMRFVLITLLACSALVTAASAASQGDPASPFTIEIRWDADREAATPCYRARTAARDTTGALVAELHHIPTVVTVRDGQGDTQVAVPLDGDPTPGDTGQCTVTIPLHEHQTDGYTLWYEAHYLATFTPRAFAGDPPVVVLADID